MSFDTMAALIGFAFVMSVTPGPSNFLLLASGVNFGFARSIPLALGISAGFLSMVLVVGLGFGQVLQALPSIGTALKLVCAGYVLWLAWKIAGSSVVSDEPDRAPAPISFAQAALFQLVNPKAWAAALVVTVSYTDPHAYVPSLVALIVVFAAVNLPSISVWAAGGVALRRIIGDRRVVRVFNIVMAALLVGSMAVLLWGSMTP